MSQICIITNQLAFLKLHLLVSSLRHLHAQEKIRDTNIGGTLGFCWNFTGFLLVSLRSVPTLEM